MIEAVLQTDRRRFPVAAAWLRCQVSSCRVCDGQRGSEADFQRALPFPLPIHTSPAVSRSITDAV
jgi:hypothetical protein